MSPEGGPPVPAPAMGSWPGPAPGAAGGGGGQYSSSMGYSRPGTCDMICHTVDGVMRMGI